MSITLPTIFPVTSHTDFVGPGSTFVAIHGLKNNGVDYIKCAIDQGATTVVVDRHAQLSHDLLHYIHTKKIKLLYTDNCRRALAKLSAQALDFPTHQLKIIAITGTKGKTTSSFLIEHILSQVGYRTALLSSVYNKILAQQFPTELTTQHPDYLHIFFDQCRKARVDYVIMEVAAQAISLERVFGISCDALLFTNFGKEHAEFYDTLESYFQAKCMLITQCKKDSPLVGNNDDPWIHRLIATDNNVWSTFGQNVTAQYSFIKKTATNRNTTLIINHKQKAHEVSINLLGDFNYYNVTGAFAICERLGLDTTSIIHALTHFTGAPGRFERYVLPNDALCVIDHAHNPSSYQAILQALRGLTHHLIVVCGAGGDRDTSKRPLMGNLATLYADFVFFTSDNPRSEDPTDIIQEMIAGIAPEHIHKYTCELDREQAIKKAYKQSRKGTIIALLGKGPERYQLIKEEKVYFNEAEIIKAL